MTPEFFELIDEILGQKDKVTPQYVIGAWKFKKQKIGERSLLCTNVDYILLLTTDLNNNSVGAKPRPSDVITDVTNAKPGPSHAFREVETTEIASQPPKISVKNQTQTTKPKPVGKQILGILETLNSNSDRKNTEQSFYKYLRDLQMLQVTRSEREKILHLMMKTNLMQLEKTAL